MLLSAVSLLAAVTVAQQASPQQAALAETALWKSVEPSIATLLRGNEAIGVAALIDDSGLFLAHTSAVGQGNIRQVRGKVASGPETGFLIIASDEQTQLTLLKAMYWEPQTRRVLRVAPEPVTPNVELLAVTVTGPKLGEFVRDGQAGLMRPSLRYVPLSEVRLEGTEEQLGGAFVFDNKGDIVGVLGAALASEPRGREAADAGSALGGGGGGFGGIRSSAKNFGPGNLTVTYALGREVLERVVAGFRSPKHEVQHPTIGIFFKASPSGRGVLIETVMSGSPSALAGIHAGDLVLEVDTQAVNSPVELAVALFRKNVGDVIQIKYLRGETVATARVKVVSAQDELGR